MGYEQENVNKAEIFAEQLADVIVGRRIVRSFLQAPYQMASS